MASRDPEHRRRVEDLCDAALARDANERAAFLARACAGDDALRRDVEALLAHTRTAEAFLAASIGAVAANVLAEPRARSLVGWRLGAYEILSMLGAGGMGEVYRARDGKLERDVAIKILPRAFTTDPERLSRFEREARLLARLNHPHIGAIYELQEADGVRALVLELVEGDTLADRIARGPIPITDALSFAQQIADALDAAHKKGIIHRDLKPGNIKIAHDGLIKLLDFGLAKAVVEAGVGPDLPQLPTMTIATRENVLLGTPAYMSPEQARGQAVDKGVDIWAFGCVVYEMLTGRPPFAQETMSETLAAILDRDPNWRALPAATPMSIVQLLQRCLDKDPRRRLPEIADARALIAEARTQLGKAPAANAWMPRLAKKIAGGGSRILAPRAFRRTRWWVAGVTIVSVVIAAGFAARLWRGQEGEPGNRLPLRMKFRQLTSLQGIEWFPSLSPDGKWVVYGGERKGHRAIYLQSVAGQAAIDLTAGSADDDDQPAFSPDGERIAFRSSRDGGGIFIMGRTGESVTRATRAGFKPTWSPDGTKLAYTTENVELDLQTTQTRSALRVVNLISGEEKPLGVGDAVLASWSPHGHRIAYTTRSTAEGIRQVNIWTVSADAGGDASPVTSDGAFNWNPVWSPDGRYLYFASGRGGSVNLWRVAIDERSGKRLGEAEPATTPSPFVAHLTVSADGARLAYSSILLSRNIQRLTIDPTTGVPQGDPTWLTTGSRLWSNPDPSPDGQWAVFYSSVQPENLYIARTDGTGLRQVTSDVDVFHRVPRWSPDGQWITFLSNRTKGYQELWKIRPDGSDLTRLTEGIEAGYPVWSPDGGRLAVGSGRRVYIFNPNRNWTQQTPEILPEFQGRPSPFLPNSWSPDGERLVGQPSSSAQGIVVYSFRSRSFDRLTDFGEWPVWLRDSRHVLFVSRGKEFFVIDTQSGKTRKVFSVTHDVIGPPQISRDGKVVYYSRRVTEADIWLLTLDIGKTTP